MNRKELEKKLIELIALQLYLDESDISVSSDFNDLGFDSLDAVEIIMTIEDSFDINIPDDDADKLTTVNLFADYIEKKI